MNPLFEILFEDADLLVVNKPADLVCHPTKGDEYSSLISRARLHLPGTTPHLVNRLDRETGGVVVIAKNAAAAGELGRAWESRTVAKEYLALVHGWPAADHAILDGPLGKDEQSRIVIKDCVRPDGAAASTEYTVQQRFTRENQPFSLLHVRPHTGRKHQIRIHLSHAGHPIVGDKIYGPDEDCYLALVENRLTPEQRAQLILPHQALHATCVRFQWRGTKMEFTCVPEQFFRDFIPATNQLNG